SLSLFRFPPGGGALQECWAGALRASGSPVGTAAAWWGRWRPVAAGGDRPVAWRQGPGGSLPASVPRLRGAWHTALPRHNSLKNKEVVAWPGGAVCQPAGGLIRNCIDSFLSRKESAVFSSDFSSCDDKESTQFRIRRSWHAAPTPTGHTVPTDPFALLTTLE